MDYEYQLQQFIKTALAEDIGDGDHSTLASISPGTIGKAILKIKDNGILAGVEIAKKIFQTLQPDIEFARHRKDGELVKFGDTAFEVTGSVHAILQGERLVLNCMQRMSGIATLTDKYVQKLKGYKTKLLDTRKTTPNFRLAEKEAVRIGGGVNHRFGLYDMIMLKDNHIDFCGSIETAIEKANAYIPPDQRSLKIEIESRNLEEINEIMRVGKVHRIMLDNFTPSQIGKALKLINGKYETEASGSINLNNIEAYAATGVDYISSGSITHQAVSLDMSLKARIVK